MPASKFLTWYSLTWFYFNTLSLSLSLSSSRSDILTHSQTHTLSNTLSSLSITHTHNVKQPPLSLNISHTNTNWLSKTLPPSLSHIHTYSLTNTHNLIQPPLSRYLTHTLSLALSFSFLFLSLFVFHVKLLYSKLFVLTFWFDFIKVSSKRLEFGYYTWPLTDFSYPRS